MKQDFDINEKVAELPSEEFDGFFHEIDLNEEPENIKKEESTETTTEEEVQDVDPTHFL